MLSNATRNWEHSGREIICQVASNFEKKWCSILYTSDQKAHRKVSNTDGAAATANEKSIVAYFVKKKKRNNGKESRYYIGESIYGPAGIITARITDTVLAGGATVNEDQKSQ